jgi:hypothetical protein
VCAVVESCSKRRESRCRTGALRHSSACSSSQ